MTSSALLMKVNKHMPALVQQCRQISSNTAAITGMGRAYYLRKYPVVVVNPDGSTYNIRYHEPRQIIKLPLDLRTLTEAERRKWIESRKPKFSVKIEKDFESSFSARKYVKYVKK